MAAMKCLLPPIVLVLMTAAAALAQSEDDPAALRRRIADLERRVAELETENARLRGQADSPTQAVRVRRAEAKLTTAVADTGRRTLTTQPMPLTVERGSRADHWVTLSCAYEPGGQPDAVTMHVQTRYSSGAYREVKTLTVELGSQTHDLAVTGYRSIKRGVRGGNVSSSLEDETVTVTIPWSTALKLASAPGGEASARLGPVRLMLGPEQVAAFGGLQRQVEGEPAP